MDAPPRDDYAGPLGAFYSWYIARPTMGRLLGRLIWASDFSLLYDSLSGLRALPAGVRVVDLACGAGLALRWLDPSRPVRYLGVDNSPAMLARARDEAHKLGFHDAELKPGDVEAVPVPDGGAEVCLLYNALHCVADPPTAVAEAARVLTPGGELRGSMLVRGAVDRIDRMMQREAAKGGTLLGPGGTVAELEGWLDAAGFDDVKLQRGGAMAVFHAGRAPAR